MWKKINELGMIFMLASPYITLIYFLEKEYEFSLLVIIIGIFVAMIHLMFLGGYLKKTYGP